jgi:ABC-2 type transport system ATP-binding protein
VDSLDLSVDEGSLFGFIGPNGSGKTSTLRMILGIIYPDRGRIEVLGRPTGGPLDDRAGYLPEERGLYRRMRVADVLGFHAKLKNVPQPKRAVARWLVRLGLEDRARNRVSTLSKGLQQKLQFAVAAISDPALLVLDEPFSGLDPVNVDLLVDVVLELRKRGTTVVLSTHDMSVAERFCDSVVMLHGGRKVLDGPVDDIKAERGREHVRVRYRYPVGDLSTLPGVVRIQDLGREQILELGPAANPRDLLIALGQLGTLLRYEVNHPSLHEIFVEIAGVHAEVPNA